MTELKPCPFCGGEAKYLIKRYSEIRTARGWDFGIHCTKCDVRTPKGNYKLEVNLSDDGQISLIEDERGEAIEAWNRRAPLDKDDARQICGMR